MSTEVKDDTIACLHGVRVLTMMWIVLGNTYLYMVQSVAEVPVAGVCERACVVLRCIMLRFSVAFCFAVARKVKRRISVQLILEIL